MRDVRGEVRAFKDDLEGFTQEVEFAFADVPMPSPEDVGGCSNRRCVDCKETREALIGHTWREAFGNMGIDWHAIVGPKAYLYCLQGLIVRAAEELGDRRGSKRCIEHLRGFSPTPWPYRCTLEYDSHLSAWRAEWFRERRALMMPAHMRAMAKVLWYAALSDFMEREAWATDDALEYWREQDMRARAENVFAGCGIPQIGEVFEPNTPSGVDAAAFEGVQWRDLPRVLLLENVDALSVFTPRAFQHFAPAFIIAAMDEVRLRTNAAETICHSFCPLDPDILTPREAARFEPFTPGQARFVMELLDWTQYFEGYYVESGLAYWGRRAIDASTVGSD